MNNPAYHAVIHATYSITPTVLNEIAYNQNGNVINIVPNGLYARPSGLSIPEIFPGNNLNRIPGIQLGTLGTTYDVNSWPWHNKADDYQVRDDLSIVKGAHQLKMGASWAFYKKTQDLFGNTQGFFNFNGSYTGTTLPISCWAMLTAIPNWRFRTMETGRIFLRQPTSRTPGT